MKKSILIILTILIITIVTVLFLNIYKIISQNKNTIPKGNTSENPENQLNKNPEEGQQTTSEENKMPSSSSNTASEGGSGSSGSSTSSPTSPSCEQRSISYALKNFVKDSVCLSYNGEDCIDKRVNCSVEVYNLDSSVSGSFIIKIELKELESQQKVDEFNLSDSIDPQSFKVFEKSINFDSPQEANKNYTCVFSNLKIPEKQECS